METLCLPSHVVQFLKYFDMPAHVATHDIVKIIAGSNPVLGSDLRVLAVYCGGPSTVADASTVFPSNGSVMKFVTLAEIFDTDDASFWVTKYCSPDVVRYGDFELGFFDETDCEFPVTSIPKTSETICGDSGPKIIDGCTDEDATVAAGLTV